jgi:hypothetical protein
MFTNSTGGASAIESGITTNWLFPDLHVTIHELSISSSFFAWHSLPLLLYLPHSSLHPQVLDWRMMPLLMIE